MLAELGLNNIEQLFDVVPDELKLDRVLNLPDAIPDELGIQRHMTERMELNTIANKNRCFIGGGCAPHYVPAIVDEIANRGEFVTSFSGSGDSNRGFNQAMFEYQSLMADLLEMDFVGSPSFDITIAVGHAFRIAAGITGRDVVLVPDSMHPELLSGVENYVRGLGTNAVARLVQVRTDPASGMIDPADLRMKLSNRVAALYLENPNYYGTIQANANEISALAKQQRAQLIVNVDPLSLGVMQPPSKYGADIVVGDLHPLGQHMIAGGGVAGFIAMRHEEAYTSRYKDFVYSAFGDAASGHWQFEAANKSNTSYIAREHANEFTGTNSALSGLISGVYLAAMGPIGLQELASTIMSRCQYAIRELSAIDGVSVVYRNVFKEFILILDPEIGKAERILNALIEQGILGGLDITSMLNRKDQAILLCVTECHSIEDIDNLVSAFRTSIQDHR